RIAAAATNASGDELPIAPARSAGSEKMPEPTIVLTPSAAIENSPSRFTSFRQPLELRLALGVAGRDARAHRGDVLGPRGARMAGPERRRRVVLDLERDALGDIAAGDLGDDHER